MNHRAVCFVIMPFGRKPDAAGRMVDFDRIYAEIIAPAVEAAGLDGVRADEEQGAGFIHKLMYERILLSEYAIADLTLLNANVYYELGIRHAARPETTVLTLAQGCPCPSTSARCARCPTRSAKTARRPMPRGARRRR